jgi:phospholipase/lecithinase/hemolysin
MPLTSNHPYSRLTVFGDSFLDIGHFGDVSAAHGATWPARSGTNPDWMWIEYVAHALGLPLTTARESGSNHAQAFALVDGVMEAIPGLEHLGLKPASVREQVQGALTNGKVGSGDLVIMNGGGNDALLSVLTGTGAPAREAAANAFVGIVATIAQQQPARIVTVATPDLGSTPLGGSGQGGDNNPVTAAVAHYNTLVRDGLKNAGLNTITLDGFGFFRDMINNAGAYALTNTTEPSYKEGGIGAFLLGPDNQTQPDVSRHAFSDAIHVSGTAHRYFGLYAAGALNTIR